MRSYYLLLSNKDTMLSSMQRNSKKEIMEEDGKPQPMAGFRVGTVTPTARDGRKQKSERRSKKYSDREYGGRVVSPTTLAPMAGVEMDNNNTNTNMEVVKEEGEKQFVYFPVEVELENLVDWKEAAKEKGKSFTAKRFQILSALL